MLANEIKFDIKVFQIVYQSFWILVLKMAIFKSIDFCLEHKIFSSIVDNFLLLSPERKREKRWLYFNVIMIIFRWIKFRERKFLANSNRLLLWDIFTLIFPRLVWNEKHLQYLGKRNSKFITNTQLDEKIIRKFNS